MSKNPRLVAVLVAALPFMFYVSVGTRVNFSIADLLVPIVLVNALSLSSVSPTQRKTVLAAAALYVSDLLLGTFLSSLGDDRFGWAVQLLYVGKLGVCVVYLLGSYNIIRLYFNRSESGYVILVIWTFTAALICFATLSDQFLGTALTRHFGGVRATGSFEDPNLFGAYLNLSIVVASLVPLIGGPRYTYLAVPLFGSCVLLTGSRGAVATTALILGVLLLQMAVRRTFLALVLAALFGLLLRWGTSRDFGIPALDRIEQFNTNDSRYDHWREVLSFWGDRIFFGHGPGSVYTEFGVVTHNTFVAALVETGIVGFAFLMFVPVWVIARCAARPSMASALVATGVISVCASMATLDLQNNRFVWVYFATSLVLTAPSVRRSAVSPGLCGNAPIQSARTHA